MPAIHLNPLLINFWVLFVLALFEPSKGAKKETLLSTYELIIIFLNGIGILEFERNLLTEKRTLVTLELSNLIIGFNDKLLLNGIPK